MPFVLFYFFLLRFLIGIFGRGYTEVICIGYYGSFHNCRKYCCHKYWHNSTWYSCKSLPAQEYSSSQFWQWSATLEIVFPENEIAKIRYFNHSKLQRVTNYVFRPSIRTSDHFIIFWEPEKLQFVGIFQAWKMKNNVSCHWWNFFSWDSDWIIYHDTSEHNVTYARSKEYKSWANNFSSSRHSMSQNGHDGIIRWPWSRPSFRGRKWNKQNSPYGGFIGGKCLLTVTAVYLLWPGSATTFFSNR